MIPDAEKVIRFLIENHLKIASAESCTGGLVSAAITDISGASAVFDMGVVSYANRIKRDVLGVPEPILLQYGAVSSQTAMAMAQGICRVADADIGISTTGIAGPGGGTLEKPVGLVYLGFCIPLAGICTYTELHLHGTRDDVRRQTVETLFAQLIRIISEHSEILSSGDRNEKENKTAGRN